MEQIGVPCAFCKTNEKKSVKFGLGGRSNISLPRIGGSHPVPSLSLLLTERRGYSNVLASFSLVLIIHWSSHKCGHKRKTFCIYGKTSHVLRCISEDNSSFCSHCYVICNIHFYQRTQLELHTGAAWPQRPPGTPTVCHFKLFMNLWIIVFF